MTAIQSDRGQYPSLDDVGRKAALYVCDAIARAMFGGCEFQYLIPDYQRSVQRAAEGATQVLIAAVAEYYGEEATP